MDSILDRVSSIDTFFVRLRKDILGYEQRNSALDASADRTPCCMFVSEALKHNDVRDNSEIFRKAKQAEISWLSERGTLKIVVKADVTRNANIIDAGLANVLKYSGTANETPKARFVAQ